MLMLTVKTGEYVMIGDEIKIRLEDVGGGHIRVGVEAPRELTVLRQLLYEEQHPDQPRHLYSKSHMARKADQVRADRRARQTAFEAAKKLAARKEPAPAVP